MNGPACFTLTLELPRGLKYDGLMEFGDERLAQFTEYDDTAPSYGCSFYVNAAGLLLADVLARREEKRLQFAAAMPPLPNDSPLSTLNL